jgi:uncharacterized protein YabN with tetrapyrrole methylase and pyrophosphatase domain
VGNVATGSLTVVGTGIRCGSQITFEARVAIEQAEKVLTVALDPLMERWLTQLNPRTESLHSLYRLGMERRQIYEEMTERVLQPVRSGLNVCFAVYGHPAVLVYSSHQAVQRARREGFPARMLPGISAEDCLFADLGIELAASGCQSFEANDFLIYRRVFDPHSALVLWQFTLIGESKYTAEIPNVRGLRVLTDYLRRYYPADHPLCAYEAAQYPSSEPIIERFPLEQLPHARVPPLSTLFVPSLGPAVPDQEMLRALGFA